MPSKPESMLVVERRIPGTRSFPLEQQICLIGASNGSDIFIDSPYISRMHAQITKEKEAFRIRDLDSKNGTFVNGSRLKEEHRLRNGDRIELAEGQVVLRFLHRGTTITVSAIAAANGADMVVDDKSREVWVDGVRLEPSLSRKEFDLLELLYRHRGQACSKDDIAKTGWPERETGDVGDPEIEQSIRRLRLRIEPDASSPKFVLTVRGYGYKLAQG